MNEEQKSKIRPRHDTLRPDRYATGQRMSARVVWPNTAISRRFRGRFGGFMSCFIKFLVRVARVGSSFRPPRRVPALSALLKPTQPWRCHPSMLRPRLQSESGVLMYGCSATHHALSYAMITSIHRLPGSQIGAENRPLACGCLRFGALRSCTTPPVELGRSRGTEGETSTEAEGVVARVAEELPQAAAWKALLSQRLHSGGREVQQAISVVLQERDGVGGRAQRVVERTKEARFDPL